MWMRLVRSPGLTSGAINRTIEAYEENDLPAISAAPGCLGVVFGENHVAGNLCTLAFWESLDAIAASRGLAETARDRAAEASDNIYAPIFDQYEITFDRSLEMIGAAAGGPYSAFRFVRFEGLSTEGIERTAEAYRNQDLEAIEATPGFSGLVLGENREDGRLVTVSFWTSRDAMRASEESFLQSQGKSVAEAEASNAGALVDRFDIRLTANLEKLPG
jgi:heme-degrading monooxygenase HmoA